MNLSYAREGEGIGLGQHLSPSRDRNDGRLRLFGASAVITMTGSHFASHHRAPQLMSQCITSDRAPLES